MYQSRNSSFSASNGDQELWNPDKTYCDYPDRVNCGDRPICKPDDSDCNIYTTPTPNRCELITCGADGYVKEHIMDTCLNPSLQWNILLYFY